MWRNIRDPGLLEAYRAEAAVRPGYEAIARMLEALRASDIDGLFAVTSLGVLRLTTAPSWLAEDRHPSVDVVARKGGHVVSFALPGARCSTSSTECDERTLLSTVEMHLLRLFREH